MPNYQDAMIYTIRSLSREDLIYVGSTCARLSKRFHGHKHSSNTCSSKQIIDLNDSYIELYENFPCNSKNELLKREGEIIRSLDCVNKCIAGRNQKQYYSDNKIKIQGQMKQYKIDNKIKIQDQMKHYRDDNKIKIQGQMKHYRDDNKNKLQNQMKQYRDDNKIKIQGQMKQYRDDNKNKLQNQMKQYRDDNKIKIQNQRNQYRDNLKRECICGGKYIDIPSLSQIHYNSNLHIAWVENFYERLNDNS